MNKAIIAVVVLIIIGGGAFVLTREDSKNNDNPAQTSTTETSGESSGNSAAENELDPNNYTEGAEIGDTLDATDQSEVNLTISDNIFDTTYLKVKKGTKVTWTNQGTARHDVTSDTDSPKKGLSSELLDNGQSYSFTFDDPGVYEYFCTPHASQMKAVVTVAD